MAMKDGLLNAPCASQRIDKWLWYARLVKSRTLAATFIKTGKIRLNRIRVRKSSQVVKVGDIVTATIARRVRVLRVVSTGVRRGPAGEAQSLYEELTPEGVAHNPLTRYGQAEISRAGPGGRDQLRLGQGVRSRGSGRPTKKERRVIERLKGGTR